MGQQCSPHGITTALICRLLLPLPPAKKCFLRNRNCWRTNTITFILYVPPRPERRKSGPTKARAHYILFRRWGGWFTQQVLQSCEEKYNAMKARRPTLLALFFLPILYLLLCVWKLTVSETWFTKPIPSYHPEMPRNKLPKKQGKSRKTPITLLSAEACNSSLPPKVQILSHPKRSMAWQKSITSTGLVVSHCSADIPCQA